MHACLRSLQGWADRVRAKSHSAALRSCIFWSIFGPFSPLMIVTLRQTKLRFPSHHSFWENGLPLPRSCAGGGRALHAHSQVSEAVAGNIDRSGGWEGDAANGQPRGV